jgi:hypothetical protein
MSWHDYIIRIIILAEYVNNIGLSEDVSYSEQIRYCTGESHCREFRVHTAKACYWSYWQWTYLSTDTARFGRNSIGPFVIGDRGEACALLCICSSRKVLYSF